MKRSSSSSRGGGGGGGGGGGSQQRKRYATTETRGPSEYKREWSQFMTNISRKRVGKPQRNPNAMPGGSSSKPGKEVEEQTDIKASMDLSQMASSTFSYLFDSKTASKKAKQGQNTAQQQQQQQQQQKQKLAGRRRNRGSDENDDDDDGYDKSRMERAAAAATAKGVELSGLNRKQRRAALQLTENAETLAAAAADEKQHAQLNRKVTARDLMDPKLQWYQQAPYPLDEITEKLVNKKALKHAKVRPDLNLTRYNWQLVHPSWMAARERRRYEAQHWLPEGEHITFADDDDDGDDDGNE